MNEKQAVNNFVKFLKKHIAKAGLSIPEFAEKMGVPKSTVYAWINQSSVMSLEKYYRALKVLNITEKLIPDESTTETTK